MTILGSLVNTIGGTCMTVKEHENPRFDNEQDIHMSSVNYDENDDDHDLDLSIISH